ncbi:hypothetical protein JCM6882_001359 [Rhodosporidiobolus microsporus]
MHSFSSLYSTPHPPSPSLASTATPPPAAPLPLKAASHSTSASPNRGFWRSASPFDMHSDSFTPSAAQPAPRAPPPPARTTGRTARPPSRPSAADTTRARSASRRRPYRLPSPPKDAGDYCCCCEASGEDEVDLPNNERRARGSGSRIRSDRRRSSAQEHDDDDAEEVLSSSALASSGSGESLVSTVPSSSARGRLFDSDDDDDDVLSAYTTDDTESIGSFSPATPASWWAPPARKTSFSRSPSLRKSSVTRSDPLISPSSSPSLSFGRPSSRRGSADRGHWMPPPPATTAFCANKSPELPDTLQLGPAPSPPPSPPRRLSPPVSLLTKSLRSLSRLPNLLPRLPTPESYLSTSPPAAASDSYDDLSGLAPGWGSAERRRILAEEPSHAADEARGFTLSRRRVKTPVVDEVEAAVSAPVADGLALTHLDPDGSRVSPPPSPTSPTADLLPFPHPLPVSSPLPSPSASDALADPFSPVPISSAPPPTDAAASSETAPPTPPAPPPRFISNHRHLLMLSLEFEMMRHAKIRGPLRQRAVIVRQASPPRKAAAAAAGMQAGLGKVAAGAEYRVESALRREVLV